jgi:ketosteroid isomerase-like protein
MLTRTKALRPEDLADLLVQRVNNRDLDGLVALYEPEAVLALPDGRAAKGAEAIAEFWSGFLKKNPQVTGGKQAPALVRDDLALTSSRLPDGTVTAEIARRQQDGTWLWVVDRPRLP